MLEVDEKEEYGSSDSRDDGTHIQYVVDKRRMDRSMEIVNKGCLTLGFHNGMLQVFPSLWAFPKNTAKKLIKNWYVENQREKAPPLALLDAKYVGTILAGKTKFMQMKSVMQMIERFAKIEGIYKGREGWNLAYTELMWEKVGNKHLMNYFGGKTEMQRCLGRRSTIRWYCNEHSKIPTMELLYDR